MLSEILKEDGEQSLDDEDSETCTAACAEENSTIEQVETELLNVLREVCRLNEHQFKQKTLFLS